MADLILRDTDPDRLRAAIVRDVLDAIRPLLRQPAPPDSRRCCSRDELAKILGWSIAKLDRRTKAGAIPSIMDDGRRIYIVDDVLEALKQATPEAETKAAERQAAKRSKRQPKV
ncbi:hypothetical protein Poly24_06670 [Rosistilla carotiformis]|uniref:Uncharacterized protein n=1 Tax=Rosistilla carotiformis TaxID=2528017 RepID=A0A518JN76_9BACT|nr:hypothetical protein [Rosistilla carotiformis]QDV66977.1 hypothetical protein Poly24_06670 [Rosistilla carotiformis]